MYTDTIADMLTRIRNIQLVKKSEVVLPYSKIKFNIAKILEANGWLDKVEILEPESKLKSGQSKINHFKQLKIKLSYLGQKPKIEHLKRISKPGRRVYVSKDEIPTVLNGYGLAIISTSRGLMTNEEAKKAGLGGEIICEIY